MARRAALVFLAAAPPLMLLCLAWEHPAADALFTLLAAAFPVALISLGAARGGRLEPLKVPLAVLLALLVGSSLALLLLRGRVETAPWVAGLPLAAAVQLGGLFLAPLLLVALAYALTFDRFGGVSAEQLERLRSLRRGREGGEREGGG